MNKSRYSRIFYNQYLKLYYNTGDEKMKFILQRPGWHFRLHFRSLKRATWYLGVRHMWHEGKELNFTWREIWFDFFIVSLVATRYCGD